MYWTAGTVLRTSILAITCLKCSFKIVLNTKNLASDYTNQYGATRHTPEFKVLSDCYKREKNTQLCTNDSVIALLRTAMLKPNTDEVDLKKLLVDMSSSLKIEFNPMFKAKLELFRKNLGINENVISNHQLARIDTAFIRFGRNTGLDVFIPTKFDYTIAKRYIPQIQLMLFFLTDLMIIF